MSFYFNILLIYILISTKVYCSNNKMKDFNTCKNFQFDNSDFNLNSFLGIWYPLQKSTSLPFFSTCDILKFSTPEGKISGEVTNRKSNVSSTLKMNLTNTKNKNSLEFSYLGISNVLTILDSDYTNYAVIYVCTDLFISKIYNVLILSRSDTLPQDKINQIINTTKNKIGSSKMISIDQNCS